MPLVEWPERTLIVLLQCISGISRQWKSDYEGEVVTDVLKEACNGIRIGDPMKGPLIA